MIEPLEVEVPDPEVTYTLLVDLVAIKIPFPSPDVVPTDRSMFPVLSTEAIPEEIVIEPVAPELDVPLRKKSSPLTPFVPLLAEESDTIPLEDETPIPDKTDRAPPVFTDSPPFITVLPPILVVPDVALPAVISIPPPVSPAPLFK
jgi:hypothetical protein